MNWFKSFWKGVPSAGGGERAGEHVNSFTPSAQQVLALARREADRLNHHFVGTEHLLLGLIRLGRGTAVTALGKMGLDLETVRLEVEKQVGTGPEQKMIGNIPYTPRVKKVLALAAREARAMNHTYVGTEHILLGLLREGDGVAPRVLKSLGVNVKQARLEILRELDPNSPCTANDGKPSETPQIMNSPKPELDSVDVNKRYDVYCTERQELVVYRNALFKGRKRLLSTRQPDFVCEFIELEQSNGQTVFLSSYSVQRFCEHGGETTGEIIRP